jgi:1,4-alpha-glucan branching enzyme
MRPEGALVAESVGLDLGAVAAVREGRHGDPFAILGPFRTGDRVLVRTFQPGARRVEAVAAADSSVLAELRPVDDGGLFAGEIPDARYVLRIHWPGGVQETEDPYAFGLLLGELDLHLIAEGRHRELGEALGAHVTTIDGVRGVRFAVWAPSAWRCSVVGDFNSWDGRRHPMRLRKEAGVWELFVPRLEPGTRYKYELIGPHGELLPQKADPVARASEAAPATASLVSDPEPLIWTDHEWMERRAERQAFDAPMSIYEVHAGSWIASPDGRRYATWHDLAERLVPYVAQLGFTHIELLPISEHPFGGSWGYQPLGQFAPTGRYGGAEGFAHFVDRCHAAGVGVIIDWVPAHFPTDSHGLAQFDGTALYEHEDPREGFHKDWNTLIYNLGRREVSGFLIASALEWLERYHVDGLRVDAVASMLYRNYSRAEGEWIPNIYGGAENLESVEFLRHLNGVVRERCPGVLTIAEESTAWPGVTSPPEQGGLGFHYKWNMGWMHDTLEYMEKDPIHRQYHHHQMTFGMVYAYSEKFVLPISHDEVVHGKGSLLNKMPGDEWLKCANLRAYLGFMWTHPGKKLLFMGQEIGQWSEWNHDGAVDWRLLDNPRHRGLQRLVRDLNRMYRNEAALHATDDDPAGFQWVIGDDSGNSIFAFLRLPRERGRPLLVVSNMTPIPRHNYRIGVPRGGFWREVFNSDAGIYAGSNMGNEGGRHADAQWSHGQEHSLNLTLPPLATVVLGPAEG